MTVKIGDLVCLRKTFYPRVGSPQMKTFKQELGIVLTVKSETDKNWSVCKIMWESGTINVQFSEDLEIISEGENERIIDNSSTIDC